MLHICEIMQDLIVRDIDLRPMFFELLPLVEVEQVDASKSGKHVSSPRKSNFEMQVIFLSPTATIMIIQISELDVEALSLSQLNNCHRHLAIHGQWTSYRTVS